MRQRQWIWNAFEFHRDNMCLLTCCVVEIHLSMVTGDTYGECMFRKNENSLLFWPTSMIKMFWLHSWMAHPSYICWRQYIDSLMCSQTTGWLKFATCSSNEMRIARWTQTKYMWLADILRVTSWCDGCERACEWGREYPALAETMQ